MLAWAVGVHSALAQNPIITSFSQNGLLICSNLSPYSMASVEWASSLAGPWHTDWSSLSAVTVGSNETIQVSVPMFYRVRGLVATGPVTNTSDGMSLIPAGSFMIGDTLDGEGDALPTNVYVSAFYMDTNLVSYSQWQRVYNYATNRGYTIRSASAIGTNHPVNSVEWLDCVLWCNARSQLMGLAPVYYSDVGMTQVLTNGAPVYANWAAGGLSRLPTGEN